MNQQRTMAIVLGRVTYGEADRIITVLTPDHGKLGLMARGVRRVKSKLAGGIELFSTSEIVFVRGRGSVGTLVSARLQHHYGNIAADINRTMLGYELLKLINQVTEDETEPAYYHMLETTLGALDDPAVPAELVRLWFTAQLLRHAGHTPNLKTSVEGMVLQPDARYDFDYEAVAFRQRDDGGFGANEIKFLRLLFANTTPKSISAVDDAEAYAAKLVGIIVALRQNYLRV